MNDPRNYKNYLSGTPAVTAAMPVQFSTSWVIRSTRSWMKCGSMMSPQIVFTWDSACLRFRFPWWRTSLGWHIVVGEPSLYQEIGTMIIWCSCHFFNKILKHCPLRVSWSNQVVTFQLFYSVTVIYLFIYLFYLLLFYVCLNQGSS